MIEELPAQCNHLNTLLATTTLSVATSIFLNIFISLVAITGSRHRPISVRYRFLQPFDKAFQFWMLNEDTMLK